MKRLTVMTVSALLALFLSGCGETEKKVETTETTVEAPKAVETDTTTTTPADTTAPATTDTTNPAPANSNTNQSGD